MSVQVELQPPKNLIVNRLDENTVQVSWNKSPSSDYGHVDVYAVYNKKITEVVFPSIPALTRYDILDSYTDTITGLDPGFGYDFIVYAFTADSVKSTFDCVSCKDSIAASYIPPVISPPVGGGYSGGIINIAQKSMLAKLSALKGEAVTDMHPSAPIVFLQQTTITEILKWPMWKIPEPVMQFLQPDIVEEFTKWPMWKISK